MNTQPHNDSIGFFYRKNVIRWILFIFYLCCAALFLVDFFIHRHIETDVERFQTFYALYGLIACTVLVFLSKLMRVFLIREENYYDETEHENDYLSAQNLEQPIISNTPKEH